jgi:hypothetical protein
MSRIMTRNENGNAMVWKLVNGVAITADIEQRIAGGFLVKFRGATTFFFTKTDALKFAKKWVREA